MPNTPALRVSRVTKTYAGRVIFRDLNFEMPRGQFTVLLGKNGTGKSTFLRLLAGIEAADAGEILVLNSNVEREDLARRQAVALVSEMIAAGPQTPVSDVINIQRALQPRWDQKLFLNFVAVFNLPREKMFGALSRGQKVQLFFAIAAASRPDLYLLDEVTSVLDANARFEVMNHLRTEVNRGATVLLATNIAAEAHGFADNLALLVDGKFGLECSVEDLQARFAKIRIEKERLAAFKPPAHVRPVGINRDGSISFLLPAELARVEGLDDQRGVTIEDAFIYYTGPENA